MTATLRYCGRTAAARDTLEKMQLSEVFLALGQPAFAELLRTVSIGKLKTYQLYERVKLRFHLAKLNSESLRKSAPRLWARIEARDEEFATDVAQTVLVSHLDMIKAVLDFLEVPHDEGFFQKDFDVASRLTEGWQQRVWERFRGQYPDALLVFYINHLNLEVKKSGDVFKPTEVVAG